MRLFAFGIALAASVSVAPASAAVSIRSELSGGQPIVFAGENGNRFGVIGLNVNAAPVGSPSQTFTIDKDFIVSRLSNAGSMSLVSAYYCPDFANALCSPLTSFEVTSGQRVFRGLLLEFSSSNGFASGTSAVFSNASVGGGTQTLNMAQVTRMGSPPVTGAIPEPGTWMLMILGLGAVGWAMRRPKRVSVRFGYA